MDEELTMSIDFENDGFVRIRDIVAPHGLLPISRSTWWLGVKSKRYPQPVELGPRITVWRMRDIRALIEQGAVSDKER